MTNTPHSWDRRADESDHAFEACAAYLDTGSLRDAYRQQTGKEGAKQAPGRWTGWSTKHNWVSRRAAYVEWTVRECQDAIKAGLVQIRKRFIDVANGLLNDKPDLPSIRAASQLIHDHFPPIARAADVSEAPPIEDLPDYLTDEDLNKMRAIRDAQRPLARSALLFAALLLLLSGDSALAQTRNDFVYWDANGNGDLTCTEARGKDEGLKLPAYADNRNGTRVIYEWLERRTSSDTDNDGIACESTSNPNGYVPGSITPPPPPPTTNARECPAGSATWMGLPVCKEGARAGYDRNAFGSAYSSLEDEIIDGLPKSSGQVYTPYTCKLFDIRADGTAATDIEHIVALAEAYDSGLAESQFRTFAGDLANLTLADPNVNRSQKSDRDAGDWGPPQNSGWFAARVVAVKQKYGLAVNPAERNALQAMLNSDPSRTVTCGF